MFRSLVLLVLTLVVGACVGQSSQVCEERQEVLKEAQKTVVVTAAEALRVLIGEDESQMFQFADNAPQTLDRLGEGPESSSVDLLRHRVDSISDGVLEEETEVIDAAVSSLRLAMVQMSRAVSSGDLLALEEPMQSVQLILAQSAGIATSIEEGC